VEGIVEYRVRPAAFEDIQRVHFCVPDEAAVTTESHLISAGGCLVAADAVLKGEVESAFALVRPPGHHAMRVVHGNRGFCNVHIEAIMIEYIREQYGIERIAIVDTDCHHGDGTQDIYWHDPNTLFISIHQDGRTLYPGSGFPNESGGPNAQFSNVNIPLPPNTGEEGFLYALDELVLPLLEKFRPELVINSAGQDNHFSDPITHMNFSARGYAILNSRLRPDIAVLEGGYAVESALPYVNVGIIMAMAGMDISHVKEPNYDTEYRPQPAEISRYIEELVAQLQEAFLEEALTKTQYEPGKILERERDIYYDTDGIHERQKERVRACCDCAGALAIDSTSSLGQHVFAVHIPRNACRACRDAAMAWHEEARRGKAYDQVYLQDRVEKTYERT
jgi:acetoin utilization deacetylase AcuC-like enzyme